MRDEERVLVLLLFLALASALAWALASALALALASDLALASGSTRRSSVMLRAELRSIVGVVVGVVVVGKLWWWEGGCGLER